MQHTHHVTSTRQRGAHWQVECMCPVNWPPTSEQQAKDWAKRHQRRFDVDSRPDWDTYFLAIAYAVSLRADCRRARHGAVIVKDRRIVATGYNGGPSGGPSCLAGECPRGLLSYDELPPRGDYSNCIALHAEVNAVAHANRSDTVGAAIYVTGEPCDGCRKVIAAAGITETIYRKDRDERYP